MTVKRLEEGNYIYKEENSYDSKYIKYEVYEYSLDVEVYNIYYLNTDGTFKLRSEDDIPVDDVKEAGALFRGFIRWDGCSNWDFLTQNCMMHFCGKEGIIAHGKLLEALYDLASQKIPNWLE